MSREEEPLSAESLAGGSLAAGSTEEDGWTEGEGWSGSADDVRARFATGGAVGDVGGGERAAGDGRLGSIPG